MARMEEWMDRWMNGRQRDERQRKAGKDEAKKKKERKKRKEKDSLSSICELLDATRLRRLAHSVKHVSKPFIQVYATKYFTQIF